MICCVSPSEVNFHESLNALRYANRARNIKNKPKINRDPTLVMISDLKDLVQVLATELVDVRRSSSIFPDNALSLLELENIVLNRSDFRPKLTQALFSPRASKIPGSGTASRGELETEVTSSASGNGNGNGNGNGTGTMSKLGPRVPLNPLTITKDYRESSPYSAGRINSKEAKEIASLKSKVTESDSEVKRLTEKLRQFRVQSTDQAERLILTESERDYFRMKWSDLNPEEAATLSPSVPVKVIENEDDIPPQDLDGEDGDEIEKKAATRIAATYLREISTLRRQLAEKNQMLVPDTAPFGASDIMLESELATNVARVIAQTEKHLKVEARRLRSIGVDVAGDGAVSNVLSALDEGNDSDDRGEIVPSSAVRHAIEEEDLVYQRRQKVMIEEVAELGESIELKEQLLGQLRRSHHQYGMMKAFYEQKLTALNAVMCEKQQERERMVDELNHFELNTTTKDKLQSEQENRLRVQLQKKDDELRLLKKRQEELSSLSKVQSRYMAQLSKLEADIDSMRKQKVDLSKALQVEKKKHFILLNDKAREIDKLKKDLIVTAGEAKRLGQEKVRAEEKVKEVGLISVAVCFFFHTCLLFSHVFIRKINLSLTLLS